MQQDSWTRYRQRGRKTKPGPATTIGHTKRMAGQSCENVSAPVRGKVNPPTMGFLMRVALGFGTVHYLLLVDLT